MEKYLTKIKCLIVIIIINVTKLYYYLRNVRWGRGCDIHSSMVCISVRPEYENREPNKNGVGNNRLNPRLFDGQID